MVKVTIVDGPGKREFDNLLKGVKNLKLKVGFFESAVYENGTPVAYVAAIQNFGDPTHNIPPRDFMGSTVAEKEKEWQQVAQKGAEAILKGNTNLKNVLDILGHVVQGDIQTKISKIMEPPLKDATVKARIRRRAKGRPAASTITKPLIDEGIMLNSVTHVIEE